MIIVPGGGGGGVLPYISYIGMAASMGRVFAPFWSEHFAHFGLESGMVFEGTTGVYERILVSIPNGCRENEKYANSK